MEKNEIMNKISRRDYEKLQEWHDNINNLNINVFICFLDKMVYKYDWVLHAETGKYDICNDEYQHSIDFTLQCKKENECKYIDNMYVSSVYCEGSESEDLAKMYSDVPFRTNFGVCFGECFYQFYIQDFKYFLKELISHLQDFVEDGKN